MNEALPNNFCTEDAARLHGAPRQDVDKVNRLAER